MRLEEAAMHDRASQLITTALDQLAAALAAGHSTSLTAVLRTMARFHRYSWTNQLLISMQRPEATRVAGFRTWLTLRRAVRRGEKGIAILAPMMRRDRSRDDGVEEQATRVVGGFRTVFVFDVAQTDGEALPDFARTVGDPGSASADLESLLSSRGVSVARVASISGAPGALGASFGGRIEIRDDLPPAEAFTTLLHEAAHELLHRDPVVGRLTHTVRELEADAVACVVAEALGLDAVQATADYIHLHQGSAELLAASLGRIRKVAGELLDALGADASTQLPQRT